MPSKTVSFQGEPSTWDFTALLEIHNPAHGMTRTCVGYAPSQGRRCWNPYNAGNRAAADRILLLLPSLTSRPKELKSKLYDLAGHCLCLRWHQGQAENVADDWFDLIMDHVAEAAARSPKKAVKTEPSSPKAFVFSTPAPVTPVRKLRTPASFDSGYFGSAASSSTSLDSDYSTPPTEDSKSFAFTFTPASPCEGKDRRVAEASSPPASPSPAPRASPAETTVTTAAAEAAQAMKDKLAAVARETALREIEEARRRSEAELQQQKAAEAAAAAQRLAAVKAASLLREQRWTAVAQNAAVESEAVLRVKEEDKLDEPAGESDLSTLALVSSAVREKLAASNVYHLSEFMLLGGVGAAGAVFGFGVCYALGLARGSAKKR